ncbi:hypothetical protein B1B_11055, partial [mine drainage metagenome]
MGELRPGARDHVQGREGGLDQEDVRSLGSVQRELAERLPSVPRVHLVGAAVPERGGRIGGVAERSVERRGELRRVRDDACGFESSPIQRGPDAGNLVVHHGARSDEVG